MTTIDTVVGIKITEALLITGKTAKGLASALGISYSTTLRALRGERGLTLPEIETAAAHLGVNASTLLPASLTNAA